MRSGSKTNSIQNIVTGNSGENIVKSLLDVVATLTKPSEDWGEDFEGRLRGENKRHIQFYIQSKASETPEYEGDELILSPSIKISLIEEWRSFLYPVYVFMTHTRTRETFFIRVDQESFQPSKPDQKYYQFRIPLTNKLQTDNVGIFVMDVIEHQRAHLTEEERKKHLAEYYQKYPYLFQNLGEIEKLLEVMRGSDQMAQLEAKTRIKEMYDKGEINPKKHNMVTRELIQIFRNCKDRITQIHVTDALVSLNSADLIREIPLQIERNILSFAYYQTDDQQRCVFSDFLFDALVKLHATSCYPKIRHFLHYQEVNLLQGVIRTCGALKIKEAKTDIFEYLDDPRSYVREEAVLALGRMRKYLKDRELKAYLKNPRSDNFLASIIELLGCLKLTGVKDTIIQHLAHQSRNVRKQVAFYLGEVNATDKLKDVMSLAFDNDSEVRNEALNIIINKLTNTDEEKGALALTSFEILYKQKEYQKCSVLLGIISRMKLQDPIPLLIEIYKRAPNETITYNWDDGEEEHLNSQSINVKISILEILKQYRIPDIEEDILHNIQSADQDTQVKYIIAAGEMGIQKALPLLLSLLEQDKIFWRGFILSAAFQIDEVKTKQWVIATLQRKPSLESSITCFEAVARFQDDDKLYILVRHQIIHLYNSGQNRREKRLFQYVQLFKVKEVEELIARDIKSTDKNMVSLFDRLSTLVTLNLIGHRDLLIRLLSSVDDSMKRFIIDWLGNINDEESLKAIQKYQKYPDIDIRNAVARVKERQR